MGCSVSEIRPSLLGPAPLTAVPGTPAVMAVGPSRSDHDSVRRILRPHGIRVHDASCVLEALLGAQEVQAILFDTDAPDPWRTALSIFRLRWPDCPVVLVSRLADERLWIEALAAGVHDLLPKPFLPVELDCVVRGVLLHTTERLSVAAPSAVRALHAG